jgi:hypothetical protein
MDTNILEMGVEPALELCFSSAWLHESEPDASAWRADEAPDELGDSEPACSEFGVPVEADEAVPIRAWDLGASSLRRVAAAAAFVPLFTIAEPAFASPPTAAVVSAPSQPPPVAGVSVWEALIDHRVLLTLKDGLTFRGTVLSVTNGMIVCARELDGLMVVVDPAQISYVHVEGLPGNPAPKKQQNGQGLIVLGSIATAIGGALGLATLAVGAACMDSYDGYVCPYYTLPLGIASVVHLSVGIPFLASGLRKRNNFREARQSATAPTVSAFLTPGRGGVMGGVGVRF